LGWDVPQALEHLKRALDAEERKSESDATEQAMQARVGSVFVAVEQRLPKKPRLLEEFCACCKYLPETIIEQLQDWLDRLAMRGDEGPVPGAMLLAARIFYGAYGATWREAGDLLIAAIDHEDLTVRACAAYQIGKFCKRSVADDMCKYDFFEDPEEDRAAAEGMEPVAYYWDWIRRKEIERSGVAGAFKWAAPWWTNDSHDWVLTLLEESEPEPYISYFPANLAFAAHEIYSDDPAAVRRLMNIGRFDIALAAATEDMFYPVEGMAPLLFELGEREHPEEARLASWTLAYLYNELHPKGARLGFVQRYTEFEDCDMYLLFSRRTEPDIPYAVVLYPKSPSLSWTQKKADALVDRIFPDAARGTPQNKGIHEFVYPSCPQYSVRFERGYVSFTCGRTPKGSKSRKLNRITIGYRSDIPWHPIPE